MAPADPQSISTGVAALVAAATKSSIVCRSLLTTYADAPECLAFVNSQCSAVKSALSFIYGILSLNRPGLAATLSQGSPLADAFDTTLTAATLTLGSLDSALQKLSQAPAGRTAGTWEHKMGKTWDGDSMGAIREQLGALRGAVTTILEAMELENFTAMHAHLRKCSNAINAVKRSPLIAASANGLPAPEPFSIFSSAGDDSDLDNAVANSEVGKRVLHQLRLVSKVSGWDGSDRLSIPSLSSDSGEPSSESDSPSTPQSQGSYSKRFGFADTPGVRPGKWQYGQNRDAVRVLNSDTNDSSVSRAMDVPEDYDHHTHSSAKFLEAAANHRHAFTLSPPPKSPRRMASSMWLNFSQPKKPSLEKTPSELFREKSLSLISSEYDPKPFNRTPLQPPNYSFTVEQPKTESPAPRLLRRSKSFWRKSSSLNLAQAAQPDKSSSLNLTQAAQPDNLNGSFSMQWIRPSPFCTFQGLGGGSVHPALATTSLTVPMIGDESVASKAAAKRWISAQSAAASSQAVRSEELAIEGVVSDGQSTRAISATFCCLSKRKQLDVLESRRYSDAPLAVLCFNIGDPSALADVTRKWSPLLRTRFPHTSTILVGFSPGDLRLENLDTRDRLFSRYFSTSPEVVSRAAGLAAARACGADAYLECAEGSVAGLSRLFEFVLGYGTGLRGLGRERERIGRKAGDRGGIVVRDYQGYGYGIAL